MQKDQLIFEQLMDLLVEAVPRYDNVVKQLRTTNYSEDEIEALFIHLGQIFNIETNNKEEIYNELFKRMTYYRDREKQKTPSYEPSNSEFIKLFTLFIKMRKEKNNLYDYGDYTGYTDFQYVLENFGKFWLEFDRNLKEKFYKAKTWNEFVSYMRNLDKEQYDLKKFNVVFDSGKAIVIKPDLDRGDLSVLKLGRGTNWCTAKDCFKELPDQYKDGTFYIILDYTNKEKPETIFDVDIKDKYVLWISNRFSIYSKSDIVYSVIDSIESKLDPVEIISEINNIPKKIFSSLKENRSFNPSFDKYRKMYLLYKDFVYLFNNNNYNTIKEFVKKLKSEFGITVYEYMAKEIFKYAKNFKNNDKEKTYYDYTMAIMMKKFLKDVAENALSKYENLFNTLNKIVRSTDFNFITSDFPNVLKIILNIEDGLKNDLTSFFEDEYFIRNTVSDITYIEIDDNAYINYIEMSNIDNEDEDFRETIRTLIAEVAFILVDMIFSIILQKIKNKNSNIENIISEAQRKVYRKLIYTSFYLFEFNNYDQKMHFSDLTVNHLIKVFEAFNLLEFEEFAEIKKFMEETETKTYEYINNLAYQYNMNYDVNKDKIIEDILSLNEIKEMIEYFKNFSNEKKEFFYFANFYKNIKKFPVSISKDVIFDIGYYISLFNIFDIEYDGYNIPNNYRKEIMKGLSLLTNNFVDFYSSNVIEGLSNIYHINSIEKFLQTRITIMFMLFCINKIIEQYKIKIK